MSPVRNALGFSLALAALVVSIPVGRADSPSPPTQSALPRATEAARDAMTAAERQFAAAQVRQILYCLKVYEAFEPQPTPDWAKKLKPGSSVAAPSVKLTMPDGTFDPGLGGVAPTELRDRLYALAYSGRVSNDIYDLFRGQIMRIPLRSHAIPEFIERRVSPFCAFFYMMLNGADLIKRLNAPEEAQCYPWCQGAHTF